MKHIPILSIFVLAILSIVVAGCSNKETNKEASKEAKAQAFLVEAISYSDGHAPSQAAQEIALKLAASKGFKPCSQLTENETVMIAGKILCDRIIAEYPATPAAVKAAELKNQIDQRLRVRANQRIQSMFDSNN